ncbi:MAG: class I SAM-dependent methyltransferase [Gemmatimonadota bacterium]|nr:class I SAM-dependent methyltransferase [Gemmatimonadota bacterium]
MSGPTAEEHGEALVRALERGFATVSDRIALGTDSLEILRPRNADDLISEADFVRDERLPYWADVWPSSLILAAWLAGAGLRPGSLLEFGCGLGVVTVAAMRAGHDVLATDYYEDALRFARANAWRTLGREPRIRMVDWRELPDDLGTFDHVVAADVLYERPYAALMAAAIAQTLAPGGAARIADPGRVAADAFLAECEARGLVVAGRETWPFEAGNVKQQINVYAIRRA